VRQGSNTPSSLLEHWSTHAGQTMLRRLMLVGERKQNENNVSCPEVYMLMLKRFLAALEKEALKHGLKLHEKNSHIILQRHLSAEGRLKLKAVGACHCSMQVFFKFKLIQKRAFADFCSNSALEALSQTYHAGITAAMTEHAKLNVSWATLEEAFLQGFYDGVLSSTCNPEQMGPHWVFVREQISVAKAQEAINAAANADT